MKFLKWFSNNLIENSVNQIFNNFLFLCQKENKTNYFLSLILFKYF